MKIDHAFSIEIVNIDPTISILEIIEFKKRFRLRLF